VKGNQRVARNVVDEPSEDIVESAKKDRAAKRNPFARMVLFIKQVIVELRKVVTPTRKELINFTLVVLVFVVVMMAIVSGLDTVFAAMAVFVFGTPGA
jgi:preprotein translocase subunit SecE